MKYLDELRTNASTWLTFTHLITVIINLVTASEELPQAQLPTYYLPDVCDQVELNGFNRAVIISQRGDRYDPNVDCQIRITVRNNYYIRFTFELLDLAEPVASTGVCNDYVQLYNRAGKRDLALSAPLCGSRKVALPYTSNSSSVSLVFHTDGYQELKGFRLRYERVSLNPTSQQSQQQSNDCLPGKLCSVNASWTVRGSTLHLLFAVLVGCSSFLTSRYH